MACNGTDRQDTGERKPDEAGKSMGDMEQMMRQMREHCGPMMERMMGKCCGKEDGKPADQN